MSDTQSHPEPDTPTRSAPADRAEPSDRTADSTDSRQGFEQDSGEQLTQGTGFTNVEHALLFDTQGWPTGEYTAEVVVRDDVSSRVSDPETAEFELV
jgi:hypothetical protein